MEHASDAMREVWSEFVFKREMNRRATGRVYTDIPLLDGLGASVSQITPSLSRLDEASRLLPPRLRSLMEAVLCFVMEATS